MATQQPTTGSARDEKRDKLREVLHTYSEYWKAVQQFEARYGEIEFISELIEDSLSSDANADMLDKFIDGLEEA